MTQEGKPALGHLNGENEQHKQAKKQNVLVLHQRMSQWWPGVKAPQTHFQAQFVPCDVVTWTSFGG